MSIHEAHPDKDCTDHPSDTPGIEMVITGNEKDLGGLTVRRSLPSPKRRMVGPWIFFDHIGPARFNPGDALDVRPHPHIHLATVTYLFEGEIMHRDSLGSVQAIRPGAVNLMMAGRGITHSERTPDELRPTGHRLHGLQLWLAVPEHEQDTAPAFYHHPAAELPSASHGGCEIRVMMGSAFGLTSPVKTYSPTLFAEALIHQGARLVLPARPDEERAVYVISGTLEVNGCPQEPHALVILTPNQQATLHATNDCRIAIIGGTSLGSRHIWWNFISTDKAHIERAKIDWREGRFPPVPGDDEFIPLPE